MNMTHQFQTKCHNLPDLFMDISTLSQFMRKLEKQSLIDPTRYSINKYLGDGFEFFIELFLSLHPVDNRLGIYDYVPIKENDNGVDGVGFNIRMEKSVVQIKYRSNVKSFLTANKDHLSNLFTDGMLAHNVVADTLNLKNFRHFVFTTAKGLHFYTDQEMFKNKVRCVGYNQLKNMIDHNLPFWDKARDIVNMIDYELKKKKS